MDTTEWGPSGWPLFHAIAYYYDYYYENIKEDYKKDYKNIKNFFKSMIHVLPCIYCRRSYREYIIDLPVPSSNLFEWSYHIHNKVNQKLQKQGYNHHPNPSFETVLKIYKKFF